MSSNEGESGDECAACRCDSPFAALTAVGRRCNDCLGCKVWADGCDICTPPPPRVPVFMSTDSAVRKSMPVFSGVGAYFPDALLLVAFISRVGNAKHNPGQPLHWAKEKSTDEPECVWRHMLDHARKLPPDPGLEDLGQLSHLASAAWRALANLQRACDAERAAYEAAKAGTR